jgi:hypothetical protein
MAVQSFQFGADGQGRSEAKPATTQWQNGGTPASSQDAPAFSYGNRDAGRERYIFEGHSGSVQQHGPAVYQGGKNETGDPLDGGMTQAGFPVSRNQLKLDDLVNVNGWGRIRELVGMGLLEADPAGGFRWKGQQDPQATQQPAVQEQQQQAPVKEPLAPDIEAGISTAVEKLGAESVQSLFEHTVRGNDVSAFLPDFASRLGVEPEQAQEMYSRTVAAFRQQGQQAAAPCGVDPNAYNDFVAWAKAHHPEAVRKAEEDAFLHSNLDGVRALARAYAASGRQYSDEALLQADVPEGVRVFRADNGKVLVAFNGQTMPARDAIRLGYISVSRSR